MAWTIVRIVIGVAVALIVYVIGASMLRKFHVAPPAEPDPDDIQPVDLHFRCIVCGAEVTMTAAQGTIRRRPGTAARTWSGGDARLSGYPQPVDKSV